MVNRTAVLMSIKPVYSRGILDGSKTVELRRRRPAFAEGTPVVLYATSPDRRVVGVFDAGPVMAAARDDLWRRVRDRAGLEREAFDAYFDGCDTAYAIEVLRPRRIRPTQLTIPAPQSYLMLRASNPSHVPYLALARGKD